MAARGKRYARSMGGIVGWVRVIFILGIFLGFLSIPVQAGNLGQETGPTPLSGTGGDFSNIINLTVGAEDNNICVLTQTGDVGCWGWLYDSELLPGQAQLQEVNLVVAGSAHFCALTHSRGVKCWGYNHSGQLGIGIANSDEYDAMDVIGLQNDVSALAAGRQHTCAVQAGKVLCWGNNHFGQLGDGTEEDQYLPVKAVGLTEDVVGVAALGDSTCTLTLSGGVLCWGLNNYGELGDGTRHSSLSPVPVSGLSSGVTALAGGAYHICALTDLGQVYCWGANDNGQLGDGTVTDQLFPVAVRGLQETVSAIATGANHSCVLTVAGDVWCWGDNRDGQLGDGTRNDSTTPVRVSSLTGVTAITAGRSITCATLDNQAYCWGENSGNELHQDIDHTRLMPVEVTGLREDVQAIYASGDSNCATLTSGEAVCWGSNLFKLLGDGTDVDRSVPTLMQAVNTPVTAIDLGKEAGCAVLENGVVRCWGYMTFFSDGDTLTGWTVDGLSTPSQAVAVGAMSACALSQAGEVQCWGYNGDGRLGDGTTESRDGPIFVTGLESGVVSLDMGDDSTCAVTATGDVWCWGSNRYGEIGDGTQEDRLLPVQVTGIDGPVVSVSVGNYRACALQADGRIACWGDNRNGGLGDGVESDSTSPVYVASPQNFVAVDVGLTHTCALTESGEVQCWGYNIYGQLGDNTTDGHILPAPVQGLIGAATAISVGDAHSCALLQNGSVLCWGANQYSQIGDGTTPDCLIPVFVPLAAVGPVRLQMEGGNGYRSTGPLVPELTTYIPTPLDISLDPGVVGANLLLAAAAMVLLTVATELANRTLEANETILRGWLRPANWIARLLQRIEASAQALLKRPVLVDLIKVGGIVLVYGLTFSFLEPGWNLFTLTGFYLFFCLTLGGGIVGLADDLVQWLAARRWGIPTKLHLHPANLLLAISSTGASRLFSIIPGFMLGSPQAVQIDQSGLDQRRQRALLWIGGLTLVLIGLILWLLTIVTTLIQRGNFPQWASILLGGVESLFLSIFALAVQNAFLQMLAFPDSYGRELLRWNRWAWGGGLLVITFVFYHTLVNPKGNLASAWSSLSVRLFLITSGVLALSAFGLWLFIKMKARRAAGQFMVSPDLPSSSGQEILPAPPEPQPEPVPVSIPPVIPPPLDQDISSPPSALAPPPESKPAVEYTSAPPTISESPGAETTRRVAVLIDGLKQMDPISRLRALQQLINLGKPAVDPLFTYLHHPDPWKRLMAVAALGKLQDPRAIPALQKALNDPDTAVRQISQQALNELIFKSTLIDTASKPPSIPAAPAVKPPANGATATSAYPVLALTKVQARRGLWLLVTSLLCIGGLVILGITGWLLRDRLPLLSGVFASTTPPPTLQPSVTLTPLPSATPTPMPSPTLTPTVTPTFTPSWPGEFSAPILAAIADQPLSFTADFTTGAGRVALWRCTAPECVVQDGVMRVSIENQNIVLGGYLQARDFVLQFDLLPVEYGSNAATGVFFHHVQGITDQVNFNVYPVDQRWSFTHRSPLEDYAFGNGQVELIDPDDWLTVLIVARGEEVAVYLNSEPVAYGRDTWTVGDYIFLFADAPSGYLTVEFDNVRFWNLADISGLP